MNKLRPILPLIFVFIFIFLIVFLLTSFLKAHQIEVNIIHLANLIFFVVSTLILLYQKKAMQNNNPNVFIRSVMAGMMIKMFACIIAVVSYVLCVGNTYNTPAIYISLFIYLLYMIVEVKQVMHLNKRKNG